MNARKAARQNPSVNALIPEHTQMRRQRVELRVCERDSLGKGRRSRPARIVELALHAHAQDGLAANDTNMPLGLDPTNNKIVDALHGDATTIGSASSRDRVYQLWWIAV